ncbi:MAG: KamA family radical SAM protein [Nitrospinota bacterium]|nr:KamA family radical SAM protein [Nitrospinota bacterium]
MKSATVNSGQKTELCHTEKETAGFESIPEVLFPSVEEAGISSGEFSNTGEYTKAAFRKKYFPDATSREWNDWKWQLRNRFKNAEQLERIIQISQEEAIALRNGAGQLPVGITPYYASMIDPVNSNHPIRRMVVPVYNERIITEGEDIDPLSENNMNPVPGIVHRYKDRVLFLVTGFCSTYCRYCTRSRIVGHEGRIQAGKETWLRAIEYIESTPTIRDVLISGGDPLTLDDDKLEWLLFRLKKIPHLEIVRIGTKVNAVLPQRITKGLLKVLRKHKPVWMSLHFSHPMELTRESIEACGKLADSGVPLGSQTVLLKGVNDDPATLKKLFHGLLAARVRPYYLYQCDPILGSSHFRTPVQTGIKIIQSLRGHTTGYAVPQYVIDAPGGGGKIPVTAENIFGFDKNKILLRNFEGKIYEYPDPGTCK